MLRFVSMFPAGAAGSCALQSRPVVQIDQITKCPRMFSHSSGSPYAGQFSPFLFPRWSLINQRHSFSSYPNNQYGYHHVLIKWPVSKGNTLLHDSIKNSYLGGEKIDDTVVDKLVEKIGIEDVRLMSVIVNDNGHLPLHMLPAVYNSKSSSLRKQLHDLIRSNPIGMKNINELLDIDEVNRRINSSQNNYLSNYLVILVNAINQTRQDIRYSNSHLLYDDLDDVTKHEIAAVISTMRVTYVKNQSDMMTRSMVLGISKEAKKHSHGNCHEYSCVLAEYIMNSLPDKPVEIINIKNGDHVFVVVGRDHESDIVKPDTWGRNAVVCDAWMGDIYMANELSKRLATFSIMFMDAEIRRVLKSFNPNFHSLNVSFSSKIDDAKCQLSRKM